MLYLQMLLNYTVPPSSEVIFLIKMYACPNILQIVKPLNIVTDPWLTFDPSNINFGIKNLDLVERNFLI